MKVTYRVPFIKMNKLIMYIVTHCEPGFWHAPIYRNFCSMKKPTVFVHLAPGWPQVVVEDSMSIHQNLLVGWTLCCGVTSGRLTRVFMTKIQVFPLTYWLLHEKKCISKYVLVVHLKSGYP